jgi:hypothetical protein
VSAAIAGVFGSYAQGYRALIAQAGLFHDQFVQALGTGAGAYAATEAANESPLETVEAAISQEAGIAQRAVGRDARIAQRAIATDEQMVQGTIVTDEQALQQYLKEVYLSVLARYF